MPLIPILLKIIAPIVVREAMNKAVKRATKPETDMQATVGSLIRHALTTAGGYFAAKGVIATSDVELVAGAIVTLLGVAWGVLEKRRRA